MDEAVKIMQLTIPKDRRVICISDIHGYLDLFTGLLAKIEFSPEDYLLLLGDLFTKGPKVRETLGYCMDLCKMPNVHAIRGNCDWPYDSLDTEEKEWISALPHIIETDGYIFVHGGLASESLEGQNAMSCMKNDGFMEQGLTFSKYVVTGHWPVANYCHQIPCNNPIINHEQHIIAIDGGTIRCDGQLNAFMIQNDAFSFDCMDGLATIRAEKDQAESGGSLHITWKDRYVTLVEQGGELGLYQHIQTGITLPIPHTAIWQDDQGRLCAGSYATDYHLPVRAGEIIRVVKVFGDGYYGKKEGVSGWVGSV